MSPSRGGVEMGKKREEKGICRASPSPPVVPGCRGCRLLLCSRARPGKLSPVSQQHGQGGGGTGGAVPYSPCAQAALSCPCPRGLLARPVRPGGEAQRTGRVPSPLPQPHALTCTPGKPGSPRTPWGGCGKNEHSTILTAPRARLQLCPPRCPPVPSHPVSPGHLAGRTRSRPRKGEEPQSGVFAGPTQTSVFPEPRIPPPSVPEGLGVPCPHQAALSQQGHPAQPYQGTFGSLRSRAPLPALSSLLALEETAGQQAGGVVAAVSHTALQLTFSPLGPAGPAAPAGPSAPGAPWARGKGGSRRAPGGHPAGPPAQGGGQHLKSSAPRAAADTLCPPWPRHPLQKESGGQRGHLHGAGGGHPGLTCAPPCPFSPPRPALPRFPFLPCEEMGWLRVSPALGGVEGGADPKPDPPPDPLPALPAALSGTRSAEGSTVTGHVPKPWCRHGLPGAPPITSTYRVSRGARWPW